MKGDSKQIHKVFLNTQHFKVPIYQRRYSWKFAQCERLFDDIEDACKNNRQHFIGCIISTFDGRGDYLVIDGQQRITTLSILLKAAYDLLQNGTLTSEDSHLAAKILDTFLKDRFEDDWRKSIKLDLLNEDRSDYFMLFDSERRLSEECAIHANYNYFVSRLRMTSTSIDDLYETISSLVVVDITLENSDNPQLIFESLNSTGMALTEGDKIRNFILMGLSSSEQIRYYNEYWSRIEKDCGDVDTSGFIRDYLSLKTQKIPNIKNVYQDFRKYWISCGKTPDEILGDLRTYSHAYRKLLGASTGIKAADDAITGLTHLDTTVIRPFAIEVVKLGDEGIIPAYEVARVFSIVEDFIFRRLICALPSNALNKIFATLANDIRKLDGTYEDYSDKLSFVLLRKHGSGRFPSDDEFTSQLTNRNLYGGVVNRVIGYIFSRLENDGTLETKDVWNHLEKGEYSIEHIMPQTLSEKWREDLGEEWESIHEEWLNRLANLTIVAAPYNSMFSNNPFARKRDMEHGFRESGLRINQTIAVKEKWGEAELEERSAIIAEKALSIWPSIVTTYREAEVDSTEISLDDDFDFTGRSLVSASFNGTPINTTVWADFVEIVCKLIYEMDPSGLACVAKEAEKTGLDGFLAVSATEHGRRISDSIFVSTDCNTNRKIRFIRHLFDHMGLDESSLVMHVGLADGIEKRNADTNRKLWAHIIPKLVDATRDAGCPSFQKRNPVGSYYLNGFIGCSKMHLASAVGTKSCAVWAYLYIDGGNRVENSRIFKHFYSHKAETEKAMGIDAKWIEPSEKARRGVILLEASVPFIEDESRWDEVADISANLMKTLVKALLPYIDEVKRMFSSSSVG